MYAIVNEEHVVEYPIFDVREKFPNTSFPMVIEDHHLPPGVVTVTQTPAPVVGPTQYIVEGKPVKNGSQWVQQWYVENRSAEEIATFNANKMIEARAMRNHLLRETDWAVLRAIESGQPVPASILSYRQTLRDLPTTPGFPHAVQWPDRP